jgi:hypothetical protein
MAETDGQDANRWAGEGPQNTLERRYIREYLLGKGHRLEDLAQLPQAEAQQLMREACQYATLKLAEVEAKERFRKNIHY